MPKIGELINVYDTEKEEYVMENATREEVAKKLEVNTRKISYNLYNGYKLNGRYLLSRVIGDESKIKKSVKVAESNKKNSIPMALWDEWDNMIMAAEVLRLGQGHIVTKKEQEKLVKYVERY
mgnify:CR=1 FL=1|jgi:hypothetical protein